MRKLVLIIANNDIKIGTFSDLVNYCDFFQSTAGGAWQPYEIWPIIAPSRHNMLNLAEHLKEIDLDYLILIFTGHGAYDYTEYNTDLVLRGSNVSKPWSVKDCEINNIARKQLTILDCCRSCESFQQDGLIKESHANFSATVSSDVARARYESMIQLAPNQHTVLYACSQGLCTPGNIKQGGAFSSALMNTQRINQRSAISPLKFLHIGAVMKAIKGAPGLINPTIFPPIYSTLPWIINIHS